MLLLKFDYFDVRLVGDVRSLVEALDRLGARKRVEVLPLESQVPKGLGGLESTLHVASCVLVSFADHNVFIVGELLLQSLPLSFGIGI